MFVASSQRHFPEHKIRGVRQFKASLVGNVGCRLFTSDFSNVWKDKESIRLQRLCLTCNLNSVGVSCLHEGQFGYYVLAMPMEGEFVVIGGREKFGEPKKIAQTRFELGDEVDGRRRVNAQVTRQGVTFL